MAFVALINIILLGLVSRCHCTEQNGSSGLPDKPQAVRWEFINTDLLHFHIFWQVPDDLVNYSVEVCPPAPICPWRSNACTRINCTSLDLRHKEFDCFLKELTPFCSRNVTVIAKNAFGEVKADLVFVDENAVATPLAPKSLIASSEGDTYLSISLRWEGQSSWQYYKESIYELVFHTEGAKNKTRRIYSIKENKAVLKGIQPYKNYSIYLRAQIVYPGHRRSHFGAFIGPVMVETPEGVPSSPTFVSAVSEQYSEDNTQRNVTIKWKTLSQDSWLGKPKEIRVWCFAVKTHGENNSTEPTIIKEKSITRTSLNQTILEGLNSTDRYIGYLKSCNGKHCSDRDVFEIQSVAVPGNVSGQRKRMVFGWILTTVVPIAVLIVLLVLGAVYFWRKRQRSNNVIIVEPREDLGCFETSPEVSHYMQTLQSTSNNMDYNHISSIHDIST